MKENFITIESDETIFDNITIDLGKITNYVIDPNRTIRLTFIGGSSLVFFTYNHEEETLSFDERQLPCYSISKEKFKSLLKFFDNRFAPKKMELGQ